MWRLLGFAIAGLVLHASTVLAAPSTGVVVDGEDNDLHLPGLAPPAETTETTEPENGSGEVVPTPHPKPSRPNNLHLNGTKKPFDGEGRRKRDSAESTVSFDDQKVILEEHNEYRTQVSPPAMNMRKMYWNKQLADAAQEVANLCRTKQQGRHDDPYNRTKLAHLGLSVGQNYALSSGHNTPWKDVVDAWYNEINDFVFGEASTDGKPVGHYTQQVLGRSNLVGCAMKDCPDQGEFFYCNYVYPNMDYTNPYVNGTSCDECPNTCTDNLCDCGDKICKYGGVMDLNTCECTCHHGFSGEQCEICPFVDLAFECGNTWKESWCSEYTNVFETCPIMCGECTATCPNMNYGSCKNGAVPNADCKCDCPAGFAGADCGCNLHSSPDADYCNGELPYKYPSSYCIYTNVQSVCPRMCGCPGVEESMFIAK